MLLSNSVVYYVYEYGGQYEDKWECPIGVCATKELANELKKQVENTHNIKVNIPQEEFEKMMEDLDNYEYENNVTFEDEIHILSKLFPKYDKKDIESAYNKYYSYDDFIGVRIEEVKFYK